MLESTLVWLSIGAGLVAAGLWLRASFFSTDPRFGEGRPNPVDRTDVQMDFLIAMMRAGSSSSRWNAWAAGVTAGAVLLQALSLIAHQFGK